MEAIRNGDYSVLYDYFQNVQRLETRRESREGCSSDLIDYTFGESVQAVGGSRKASIIGSEDEEMRSHEEYVNDTAFGGAWEGCTF